MWPAHIPAQQRPHLIVGIRGQPPKRTLLRSHPGTVPYRITKVSVMTLDVLPRVSPVHSTATQGALTDTTPTPTTRETTMTAGGLLSTIPAGHVIGIPMKMPASCVASETIARTLVTTDRPCAVTPVTATDISLSTTLIGLTEGLAMKSVPI